MIFWASSETDRKAGDPVEAMRRRVEPHLNALLAASSLNAIEAKLRYVPVVMPPEWQTDFPARSRLRKKQRIFDCAPQLDYETFAAGDVDAQLKCYLDGLRETARHLPELGATKEQAQEFLSLLDHAYTDLRAGRDNP